MDNKYTRPQVILVAGVAVFAFLIDYYDLSFFSYDFTYIIKSFQISSTEMGLLYAIAYFLTPVGGFIFGHISDRYGRKRGLITSIVVFSIFTALTGATNGPLEFALVRVFTGIGLGGIWGISFSLIAEAVGSSNRGLGGGIVQAGAAGATILAGVVAGLILPAYSAEMGWRMTFYVSSLFGLIVIPALFMPESKLWLKYNEARKKGELTAEQTKAPIKDVFSRKNIRITLLGILMVTAGTMSTQILVWRPAVFLGPLFNHVPIADVSFMGAMDGAAILIEMIIFGWTSDRFGRKKAMIGWAIVSFAYSLTFYYELLFGLTAWTGSPFSWIVFYTTLLNPAVLWAGYGIWLSELYITRYRATGNNMVQTISRVLGSTAAIIIPLTGSLVDGIIEVGIVFGLISIIVPFALPETRGKDLEAVEEHTTAYAGGGT